MKTALKQRESWGFENSRPIVCKRRAFLASEKTKVIHSDGSSLKRLMTKQLWLRTDWQSRAGGTGEMYNKHITELQLSASAVKTVLLQNGRAFKKFQITR